MGKKRTAEDRRRYAEENGFNDDARDVDDKPVPREVLDYTKERYSFQMEMWFEYQKTHPEATPYELKTLKHFAEFIGRSVEGYIKGPLKQKIRLSTARRPKTYLTLENYMYMERQLWQSDWHEYVHEAYRVFISAKLKCHVFTPARLGEISEGSTRKGTGKGLRYKVSVTPLVANPMLFMLAIFLAAGAFKNYHTVEGVLAVKPPPDQRYWALEWADHVLDLPVFPEVSVNGPTEKIQTGTAFSSQLREVSLRAGMEIPVTVHGMRREALIQATSNGYSKDELIKFAAHTNQATLAKDYLSSITSVDGLASFLKLPLRSDQAEDFRSKTVKRNPELFSFLPAKTTDELRQREDYVAITKELEDLSLQMDAAEAPTAICLLPCPNSDCSVAYDSEEELWYHFQDAHSYPPRKVKTKIEKEMDIFVHSEGDGVAKKRRRIKVGVNSLDVATTEGSNTLLSPLFDADKALQDECPSVTSIPSPLSAADVGNLSCGEPYPSCYSPMPQCHDPGVKNSAGNEPYQIDADVLAYGSHGTSQASLEEMHVGNLSNTQTTSSELSSSSAVTHVTAACYNQTSWPGREMAESIQASEQSTVAIEMIHPDLRIDTTPQKQITPSNQGAASKPTALDEEENIWEVEALLAKWQQGRKAIYLVKWKDYADNHNTWEIPADISAELVNSFNKAYRDCGGNHSGVKLLNKRRRRGKVEYYVRWKGRPDSENSWEKESTISRQRIREFEATG
ncbi:hypothetical protein DL764_010855 [Monosporascus ibericus]|uniref:Chromo domain-containing protein n=1 Tax=Monosporascus ibericus TaxID=155417 RepID=A0A4Q4SRW2_9PEZI|nr:hypothetical protein DL764_010855 [Monosporascus ibericus]